MLKCCIFLWQTNIAEFFLPRCPHYISKCRPQRFNLPASRWLHQTKENQKISVLSKKWGMKNRTYPVLRSRQILYVQTNNAWQHVPERQTKARVFHSVAHVIRMKARRLLHDTQNQFAAIRHGVERYSFRIQFAADPKRFIKELKNTQLKKKWFCFGEEFNCYQPKKLNSFFITWRKN